MNKANYLFIAIIAVLAMMLLFRHAPEKQVIKDYKLQRMYDSSQEVINTLSQKIKDDSLVIHNLDEAASNLGDQYLAKKKEVASLQKNAHKQDSVIERYTCIDIDSVFKARYPNDTSRSGCDVLLTRKIGQDALIDLNLYDTLSKKILPSYLVIDSIRALQLSNKDSIITLKDDQIKSYNQQIANYSNQKFALVVQRNDAEKAARKQKFKTVISQIAFLALGVAYILK